MPRYMLTLSSSRDRSLRVARYVSMDNVDDAARFARGLLEARRRTHHRHEDWDMWTVAGCLSLYRLPKILAAGRFASG